MRRTVVTLMLASALLGQSFAQTPAANQSASAAQSQPASTDDLAQMRDDLNKLESLNMNMSAETEFLRDQNLQILLRTNSQMWTLIIHDMRRQLEREGRRRATPACPADHGATARPER